jgi:parallel beta-helix repeat protein
MPLVLLGVVTATFAQTNVLTPASPPVNIPSPGRLTPGTITPANPYAPSTQTVVRPMPPAPPATPQDVVRHGFRAPKPLPPPAKPAPVVVPPPAVAPIPAGPQILVVAPEGADANAGTVEKPLLTIQRAADLAQPGDTVMVKPGTYTGFHTVRAGRREQPITFRATGHVTINQSANTPSDNILVRHSWTVVTGFASREAGRAGIAVIEAADVVVSNNVCGPNRVWGIFTGFAPRIQIVDNKAFGSAEQHGIYVSNSREPNDNPVVRGNECYANKASGIQLNGDCNMGGDGTLDGALIERNILHDNFSKAFSLISIRDSVIRNNLVYDNGRESGAAGIHLTDELKCGKPSTGNVVVNNTIVEPRIAGIRLTDGARNNIVFNNLIIGRGIVDEVGDNQIDDASNIRGSDRTEVFVSPATHDFRLRAGVKARVAGRTAHVGKLAPGDDLLGTPRNGMAPSVGACDPACPPLPTPGQYDATAVRGWEKTQPATTP